MRILPGIALTLDVVLLFVAWNTLFLQTHWNDPSYVGLVAVVVGTPLVNAIAMIRVLRKQRPGTL
jgi:hypothetical protein